MSLVFDAFDIGKTLLVKTLARVLDVPFSVSDATSFTQAGCMSSPSSSTLMCQPIERLSFFSLRCWRRR